MSADEHEGERDPRPGELCKCGRPAVTVYVTEKFGDVPYCGFPDGGRWGDLVARELAERSPEYPGEAG